MLALKNRVLMELQLHGIGKPAPDSVAPAMKPAAAPLQAALASAAPAASDVEPASGTSAPPVAQPSAPAVPFDRTAVIAVGVAAATLILGFAFRCRKRAEPDDETAPASDEAGTVGGQRRGRGGRHAGVVGSRCRC
ncbi:MAG: hypothetical protein VB137_00570 [Burkholderia sp.]